ncbi:hypothetical protein D3C71_2142660 [compost metagenome]
MRCLIPLSSTAIYSTLRLSLQPFQGLGDTEKRTEQQDLVIRRRLSALPIKSGADAGIRLHRRAEVRQGADEFGGRTAAR